MELSWEYVRAQVADLYLENKALAGQLEAVKSELTVANAKIAELEKKILPPAPPDDSKP